MMLAPVSLALLLAVQTTADAPATTAAPASTSASGSKVASAKPRMTCEEDTEIGSRLAKKRICHTAEEWKQIRLEERRDVERVQGGRIGSGG